MLLLPSYPCNVVVGVLVVRYVWCYGPNFHNTAAVIGQCPEFDPSGLRSCYPEMEEKNKDSEKGCRMDKKVKEKFAS